MAITVKLTHLRHSARKLRPVLKMFAGSELSAALTRSALMPQDSSRMLHKALKMAESAVAHQQLVADDMKISELFATEGPRIKRIRPNARGRTNKYQKHLAHLTVVLCEKPAQSGSQVVAKPKTAVATKVRSKTKAGTHE